MEPLMSDEEVAAILGRPTRALRQWRYLGQGPKYIKVGATVRYRRADIEAWIEAQAQEPTVHKAASQPRKKT